jgi:hypothetical protein
LLPLEEEVIVTGHWAAWWPSLQPILTQVLTPIIAVYAAIISTANLIHDKRTARLDRKPRLTMSQDLDENDLPRWRVQNDGRVDVFVERLGVLVWSGWGLSRWWGRRGQTLWLDPPYAD